VPDIGYSASDYHHARPLTRRQPSTSQFSIPVTKGHKRTASKFTVISNVSRGHHSRVSSGYAETETGETVKSYDPFRASRPQHLLAPGDAARANVVVHRARPGMLDLNSNSRSSRGSAVPSNRSQSRQGSLTAPRTMASRSSLASSTRSRGSGRGVRVPLRYKRGVSFAQSRKSPVASVVNTQRCMSESQPFNSSELAYINTGTAQRAASAPTTARPAPSRISVTSTPTVTLSVPKDRSSRGWHDDVRILSSSLAQTCDEAFNRTSVSPDPVKDANQAIKQEPGVERSIASFELGVPNRESLFVEPLQLKVPRSSQHPAAKQEAPFIDLRPLPAPPARSESVSNEIAAARQNLQLRRASGTDSPGHLNRLATHIDQLLQISPLRTRSDRRIVSAPVSSNYQAPHKPLPSIHESNVEWSPTKHLGELGAIFEQAQLQEATSTRITSAPEPRLLDVTPQQVRAGGTVRNDRYAGGTIRLVDNLSPSPVRPPLPLKIQKKVSTGSAMMSGGNPDAKVGDVPLPLDLHQQYALGSKIGAQPLGLGGVDDPFAEATSPIKTKRMTNWFKRGSKSYSDENTAPTSQTNGNRRGTIGTKKSFGLGRFFGRNSSKTEQASEEAGKSILRESSSGSSTYLFAGFEINDDASSVANSIVDDHVRTANSGEVRVRQVEAQQNWLARLFHVKPLTQHIVFAVSKQRARHEIYSLLKEWKKYGARDVVLDKERSIIFGRVDAKNCWFSLNFLARPIWVHVLTLTRPPHEGSGVRMRDSYSR
jgi:serine/threonine-protein kinase HSL1 (negative regulator of Swe1 kinase)